MKTAKHYRLLTEELERKAITKNGGRDITWGEVWKIQEEVIKKAMKDMREECAKAAEPVDDSLAAVVRQIRIR